MKKKAIKCRMGQIRFIKKDLFETHREIIGHGCNAAGGFGSGVAGQISHRFPEVCRAYKNKFRRTGFSLGEIQVVSLVNPLNNVEMVANLITQKTYGRTGIHVNYQSCLTAFSTLFKFASLDQCGIAMPMIGVGLGGGQWSEVEKMLIQAIQPYEVEVDIHYL